MSNCDSKGKEGEIRSPAKQQKQNPNAITGARLQPYPPSLYPKLASLNVENYTKILRKTLEVTDLKPAESRLLLTTRMVEASPLLGLLTSDERVCVYQQSGLKVRTWDESGVEYDMVFKFLTSNKAYRMVNHWNRFLRQNSGIVEAGDDIEIQAFRIPKGGESEIGMVFLLHRKKGRDLRRNRGVEDEYRAVKRTPKVKREKMQVYSREERIAVQALLQLRRM